MSYSSIVEMVGSQSLIGRVTAAAAQEGAPDTMQWARTSIWVLAAQPGWAEAWDYAKATATLDHNPDIGERPGVISDYMILSAVQTLLAASAPAPAPEPETPL